MRATLRQRGLTLIELIVFIVIVSVALVGVLSVFNVTVKSSADPMIRKQMLAIAEAILEEVQLQPFTWCDPDDPVAADPATDASGDCATPENMGPETAGGEAATVSGHLRGTGANPWDNVNDYNGLSATTTNIAGTSMPPGYSASVVVAEESLNGIAATESLRITVTVTHGSESIVLEGYRARYAPNFLP